MDMKLELSIAVFLLCFVNTSFAENEEALRNAIEESVSEDSWSFEDSLSGEDALDDVYDPLEPFNRLMFKINGAIDKVFLIPLSATYKHLFPGPLQIGISNFVSNFFSPIATINFILQGDAEYATKSTFRFIINTLLGFFGTVDVAAKMGLDKKSTSLSDTFKKWGAKSGPYLVLPILGPGSFRSEMGKLLQLPIDPLAQLSLSYWKKNTRKKLYYVFYGADIITKRASLLGITNELEKTSSDTYVATRTAVMSQENS